MIEKLNLLLNTKYKIAFLLILLSYFLLTLLELLSIASIPLFVTYIIDPNLLVSKIPFENLKKEILIFYEIIPQKKRRRPCTSTSETEPFKKNQTTPETEKKPTN